MREGKHEYERANMNTRFQDYDNILNIHTEVLQLDGKDTYFYHRYEPTAYDILEQLFDNFQLHKEDSFVDFGCGLGRVNLYVNHRFAVRSTGIEMNETYYQRSVENLESMKERKHSSKDKIRFYHQKAEEYRINDIDNIFYFFNPFSIEIFRKVLNNVYKSFEEYVRPIFIILYYPEDEYTNYLEEYCNFKVFKKVSVTGSKSDPRELFLIYRLDA